MLSKRLSVDIEPELHRRIRIVVSKKDTTIKDWLTSIILREIEREEVTNGHRNA